MDFPCTECAAKQLEIDRLQHILNVLKFDIQSTHEHAQVIESHFRVENGRLEVWGLGKWEDLKDAQAEGEPEEDYQDEGEHD